MAGIFEGFDADTTDLPEITYGPPEGKYEGCVISKAEVVSDFYKQFEKGKVEQPGNYLVFDISVPTYDFPKQIAFELPVGSLKSWTDEVITTTPAGKKLTEREVMTRRLQNIREFYRDCGVPDSAMNTAEAGDFVGLEGVLTLRKNGDYVNPARSHPFVVKNNAGVAIPEASAPGVSVPEIPTAAASPSGLWGSQR